ncbi:hypothetical protein V2J09_002449 [Rumex salicifolius]
MEDYDDSRTPESSINLRNHLLPRPRRAAFDRLLSRNDDEFRHFRSYLRWMCVDQSTWLSTAFSWTVFVVLGIAIPALSHFVLACSSCDSSHSRPFDAVIQLSLSSVAALSFLCLSRFLNKYGLRRFLFFDKLVKESVNVRLNYTHELNRSLWICSVFVLPCFAAECGYKIWWYVSGASQIPFLGNEIASDVVFCTLELLSWLYRTTVFFLLCILFRLICYLHILRLQDFASVFQEDSDVASVLSEHLRIRRHLKIISHRYRLFILCALVFITISQFVSLMLTTKSSANVNIYRAGELALCSMTLVTGLMILLRSATRITHKGQAITSLAAKWHVCATIDSFDTGEPESPMVVENMNHNSSYNGHSFHGESDGEDSAHEDDELDNMRLTPAFTYSSISFQKRQALVTYLEHHRAGITVFGFMLDRTSLQIIFGIELSLILWLLGKTVGIS